VKRRWLFVFVMLMSVVMPFLPIAKAEAVPFNRLPHHGYFFNGNDNQGGFVIRAGVHNTGSVSFVNYMMNTLNSANSQDQTGAEFIILTMMGYGVGTNKSVAHNATVIADWKARVFYYSGQGWINWHANYSYTENTYWQGKNGGGTNPDDDAWFNDSGSTGADGAIVFHKPGGGFYALRKECANPLGEIDTLAAPPPPDYNVTLTAAALTSENGFSPYSVVAGQTYSLGATVHNTGPAASGAGNLQVQLPAAGVCTPGAACPLTQTNVVTGGTVPSRGQTGFGPPVRLHPEGIWLRRCNLRPTEQWGHFSTWKFTMRRVIWVGQSGT
jgi:hypothetical protein